MVAFTRIGSGSYVKTASSRPTVTDSWVKVSFDVEIPVGATEAFLRLYNGNTEASGKAVYFDDLSVQQIWAPFGPQWALGVDDESSDTGYERITRPEPDLLLVHLSGWQPDRVLRQWGRSLVPRTGCGRAVLDRQRHRVAASRYRRHGH